MKIPDEARPFLEHINAIEGKRGRGRPKGVFILSRGDVTSYRGTQMKTAKAALEYLNSIEGVSAGRHSQKYYYVDFRYNGVIHGLVNPKWKEGLIEFAKDIQKQVHVSGVDEVEIFKQLTMTKYETVIGGAK